MQIDPFLSPCTKLKSKWIKDLHLKPDTLKLIEEKVEKSLEHRGQFSELKTNGLCSKINNQHMVPHKIAKLLSVRQSMTTIGQKATNRLGKDLYQSYIQ
jgi:hypothetical protein